MSNSTLTAPTTQYTPATISTANSLGASRWWNFEAIDLVMELRNSKYRGQVTFTDDPADISGSGVFSYEVWTRTVGTKCEPYVKLTVLREFVPRHHGRMYDYHLLGHAMVHLERGTECTAKDPQKWSEECKATEYESSNRMGFCDMNCRAYDAKNRTWIDYVPTN